MVLYLIGSQQSRTLTWLAQPVRARATTPSLIATGDSGLRTPPRHNRLPVAILAGVAAAAAILHVARRQGTAH
jgi:hypothetical protein